MLSRVDTHKAQPARSATTFAALVSGAARLEADYVVKLLGDSSHDPESSGTSVRVVVGRRLSSAGGARVRAAHGR
jgi:hypothetical protein